MAPEEKEAQENTETGNEKGGKSKMMIIIIAVVVLAAVGGAGAFFAMSGSDEHLEEDEFAEEEEDTEDVLPGAVFPLEVFIVNLGVKGSFLKTSIQLEFMEPELPHSLENDVPKLRDAIIKVLSSKTAADILTSEGKEALRDEVKDAVNEAIGGEEIVHLYFTEFIVQ